MEEARRAVSMSLSSGRGGKTDWLSNKLIVFSSFDWFEERFMSIAEGG